ncbi:MAG: hypothetical protein P8Y60_13200 [Calditrichota bacterium]
MKPHLVPIRRGITLIKEEKNVRENKMLVFIGGKGTHVRILTLTH